jgi:hypothetical protein
VAASGAAGQDVLDTLASELAVAAVERDGAADAERGADHRRLEVVGHNDLGHAADLAALHLGRRRDRRADNVITSLRADSPAYRVGLRDGI